MQRGEQEEGNIAVLMPPVSLAVRTVVIHQEFQCTISQRTIYVMKYSIQYLPHFVRAGPRQDPATLRTIALISTENEKDP